MSQLVTTQPRASVLVALGARYSVEPTKLLETLKNTVFKNATESQLMALCIVANQYGLNPFTKQIFAFPDKGGGIVPVVGVDGWIKLMNDQPNFDGIEFEMSEEGGKPVSCTSTIYIKDRSRPVKVTEYFAECSRNTDPWNKSPRRMLRHKALIQGVRVAFGLSGIQDEEEAEMATLNVVKVTNVSDAPKVKRLAAPKEAAPVEATQEPAPEPEVTREPEQEQQTEPQPLQIPEDGTELLLLAKQVLGESDIEDKDALRCLKAGKKAGTACKTLAEVARSGLVWLCEHPAEIVQWVNENAE